MRNRFVFGACSFFSCTLGILAFPFIPLSAQETSKIPAWEIPKPIIGQEWDWIRLTSDEWLKGDIIAMYDETLEFDSDELGTLTLDWSDIDLLRSKDKMSIRLLHGVIAEGQLLVEGDVLTLYGDDFSQEYKNSDLVSIASASDSEWDKWDGSFNLGLNLYDGNTEQFDYTFRAEGKRRTSSNRFSALYVVNYSENTDQVTGEETVIANNQRFTTFYDWFFSQTVFFRALDFEYVSDEFQNLDYRATLGIGLGFSIVDNGKHTWDVTFGPSYQQTNYVTVEDGTDDVENSSVATFGTAYDWEITGDIDYSLNYSAQRVSEEAGDLIQHLDTGVAIELTSDFDLDVTLYVDRVRSPRTNEDGVTPDNDDYKLVFSLGYSF